MCKQCEKNPVYEFTNQRKLCKSCFVRYFQKKFLYIVRKFEMIKKGDTASLRSRHENLSRGVVGYKKLNGFRSVVLENLLEMFSEKSMVEIVKLPNRRATKIALASTIDLASQEITNEIIKGKGDLKNVSPVNKKEIKPLYLFLDKEVLLYAKIKGLKYKETKQTKNKINDFINELEKKHPEIKRAIVNSYLKLE